MWSEYKPEPSIPWTEWTDDPDDPANEIGIEYIQEVYENPAYDPRPRDVVTSQVDITFFKYLTRPAMTGNRTNRAKKTFVNCAWCGYHVVYFIASVAPTTCPQCKHGVTEAPSWFEMAKRRVKRWWQDYKWRVRESWRVLRHGYRSQEDDDE